MATLLDIGAGRVATVATFYKVSGLLGAGRYSEVYKAFDTHHQADVALKLYVGFDPEAHELAKNEESILARLGQLNSEYFPRLRRGAKHRIQNRNHPLLVLELGAYVGVDGQKRILSLKEVIPQVGAAVSRPEPDPEFWAADSLVRWLVHMAQAVQQLHSLGIVHRDLKPANILLKRGPGQSAPVPLFLDFNSAAASDHCDSRPGTPRYLPPEVTSGRRRAPSPQDDLWAIAVVAWEILHGAGASRDARYSQHGLVTGSVPEGVIGVLRRALTINPEARFLVAPDMLYALEAAATVDAGSALRLATAEVARARTAMERIRRAIAQAMAPPGEIVIPKEVDDAVTTVIGWLSEESTQSLNLVDELVRLGPIAIPACLQQGYRLQRDSVSYGDVVTALAKLGRQDPTFAHRSINAFALSSNIGVRELCWRACEELQYFPDMLLDSLTCDEGVLLPEERLKIADLCIRFSNDSTSVLALVKYMCREYVLDRNRFRVLRTTVASRMHELRFSQTARLIWEDAQNSIWEELQEFGTLPSSAVHDTELGLIELMAEAFAVTGADGLEVLKARHTQRLAGPRRLPVFRRFATKLGLSNSEARSWLVREARQHPEDRELQRIAEKLGERRVDAPDSPDTLLREYLQSVDRQVLNKLRFWPNTHVLDRVKVHLSGSPPASEVDAILQLLRGYQTRHRAAVADVALRHWAKLSGHDYNTALEVLTAYSVPEDHRQRAVEVLNRDLHGVHAAAARRGLEQLLR
ncbi:MAG: protein kinase [Planctomycetota bacterium]